MKRSHRFLSQGLLWAPLVTLVLMMLFLGFHRGCPGSLSAEERPKTAVAGDIQRHSERVYRLLRPAKVTLHIQIERLPAGWSADVAEAAGTHLARITWDVSEGEATPRLQSVALVCAPGEGEGERLASGREVEEAARMWLGRLGKEIESGRQQWVVVAPAERQRENWRIRLRGGGGDFSVVLNADRGELVGLWREKAQPARR